jgi:hypothetical protein
LIRAEIEVNFLKKSSIIRFIFRHIKQRRLHEGNNLKVQVDHQMDTKLIYKIIAKKQYTTTKHN